MPSKHSTRTVLFCLAFLIFAFLLAAPCHAQDLDDVGGFRFVTFAGAGTLLTHGHAIGEIQTGASFELSAPNRWVGFDLEGGSVVPWSRLKSGAGIFSFNYTPSWTLDQHSRLLPFATVGYTHFFNFSHAVNYGAGLDLRLFKTSALRLEVRDYYSPALPQTTRRDTAFRIGWVHYIQD